MPGHRESQDGKAWRGMRNVKSLRLEKLQRDAQSQTQVLRQAQELLQERQLAAEAAGTRVLGCLQKRQALGRGGRAFSPQALEAMQFALQDCRAAEQACLQERDLAQDDVERQRALLRSAQERVRRAQQQLDQVVEHCQALADEWERSSEERNDEEAEEAAVTRLLQRAAPEAGDAFEEQGPRFVPGFGPAAIRRPDITPSLWAWSGRRHLENG